jgi:prefoldin subunit 5
MRQQIEKILQEIAQLDQEVWQLQQLIRLIESEETLGSTNGN